MPSHPVRAFVALVGATLFTGALSIVVLSPISVAGASERVNNYVALGDSYSAGPFIPNSSGVPLCLQSSHNYPHLLAAQQKPSSFTDVSCSGANTDNMAGPQFLQTNKPQFDALKPDTDLVSLTIGGNDIGFADIIAECAAFDAFNPVLPACKARYNIFGHDELLARTAAARPKLVAIFQGIHQRSPLARVFILGYPTVLPTTGGGCWPVMPISSGDTAYLRTIFGALNSMIRQTAAANAVTFVDTATASAGHDYCEPTGTKWVEGLVPTSQAAPVHPNALGEQYLYRELASAVTG
jgi:lysophospholipase L1-like esterase